MHYGTNTGSCGVHLVLLRPSQHSGARPGVVPHHGQILVQSFRLESMSISQPPFSYTLGDRHSEQNLAGALRGAYIRLGTYSNLYLNTVCLDSIWQIPCVLCVAQRHCAAVRGRARPPELRGNSVAANRHFFFCAVGGCGRSGPRPPRCSRACRAVLPGRRHRTHPPATSSPLLALAPRCASAVSLCNPATAVSTSGQWRLQHQERRKSAARHAQR